MVRADAPVVDQVCRQGLVLRLGPDLRIDIDDVRIDRRCAVILVTVGFGFGFGLGLGFWTCCSGGGCFRSSAICFLASPLASSSVLE